MSRRGGIPAVHGREEVNGDSNAPNRPFSDGSNVCVRCGGPGEAAGWPIAVCLVCQYEAVGQ